MRTKLCLPLLALFFCCAIIPSPRVDGHGIFKKTMEKKIENLRVTCYACHVRREPKTVRNEFGKLFHKQLKEKKLSEKWNELSDDREARKKYEEEVMAPAFIKALEAVGKQENDDGVRYIELIKAGEIEGTKLK